MSAYDSATECANDALRDAGGDFPEGIIWTRTERLAEAQVHATLAVAAAVREVTRSAVSG